MPEDSYCHTPIMVDEVLRLLALKDKRIIVDATVGGGGHTQAILENSSTRVIALDRDLDALNAAEKRLSSFGSRVVLVHANYNDLDQVLRSMAIPYVDGILFDLGVSSPQLDKAERGFSYKVDAPLDMRMDQTQKVDGAKLVNELPYGELVRIIKEYGEEHWADRIAEFIVKAREHKPILTTGELKELIINAIPASARKEGPHPARRTFQALRIAVNEELTGLKEALPKSLRVLNQGGRLAVISFHSLEDRIVKQFFQQAANPCSCPPGLPVCACNRKPSLKILTGKPLVAGAEEIEKNTRARSARLRAAERVLPAGENE
jgi:16S rRNA (cytosine1402-N4)-methyltransferase